jgi:uncharacterized protein
MSNQELIDRFFEAYLKHDVEGVKSVMAENVTWIFLGHHPLAGVKTGITEVIAFFRRDGRDHENIEPDDRASDCCRE